MRIPSSVFAVGRYALALGVVAGSVALMSAPKNTEFTANDKAYYADPNTVNFVRPGLVITIQSATIAADNTISVTYKLTDPNGGVLDRLGVQTPGAVSVSFVAAYLPKGANEFWSYTTRVQTSPITKVSATQAGADSGGTTTANADGTYTYKFVTKAAAKGAVLPDLSLLHRIAAYGSRNLSDFDLGSFYDDAWFDFVPSGGTTTQQHDVVKTAICNACHDSGTGLNHGLAAHGGSRRSIEVCVVCHTSQSIDPDTGNSVAMDVMVHKIHAGPSLPSVIAGKPYQIIGNSQSLHDYSSVGYPATGSVLACTTCHSQTAGATQAKSYLTQPTRQACGSCHDDVNFATGLNHVNLPQVSDNQCASCHPPTGELEFDASITGAHTIAVNSKGISGIAVKILKVDNGVAGKAPLVSFTYKNLAGTPILPSSLTSASISFVMAGPTSDYGYTSFGTDVTTPGYVSETATTAMKCGTDGTCTYQFIHAIPAAAKGTFAIGVQSRATFTLMAGTAKQRTTTWGAKNDMFYFPVDGSALQARRVSVSQAKCEACHVSFGLHGNQRNQVEFCLICHNPSQGDQSQRPNAQVAADKTQPTQSVNMPWMIHRIHMGEQLAEVGASYTVVGNSGSHNDFSEVRYPVMGISGSTGNVQRCYMCHVNGAEAVLPTGKNPVKNASSPLDPAGAITSACTACHPSIPAFAHAVSNTDTKFGESCTICHGTGADFNATKVHAQ